MPEIGTSGLMSGDGKRSVGKLPQATAPILDSTNSDLPPCQLLSRLSGVQRTSAGLTAPAASVGLVGRPPAGHSARPVRFEHRIPNRICLINGLGHLATFLATICNFRRPAPVGRKARA